MERIFSTSRSKFNWKITITNVILISSIVYTRVIFVVGKLSDGHSGMYSCCRRKQLVQQSRLFPRMVIQPCYKGWPDPKRHRDLGKMVIRTSFCIEQQGMDEWKWKVSSVGVGLRRQERIKQQLLEKQRGRREDGSFASSHRQRDPWNRFLCLGQQTTMHSHWLHAILSLLSRRKYCARPRYDICSRFLRVDSNHRSSFQISTREL